jgi:hypothetical protein
VFNPEFSSILKEEYRFSHDFIKKPSLKKANPSSTTVSVFCACCLIGDAMFQDGI